MRRRGLTLAEVTVVLALFGLFSTTALASLNLAMSHWRKVAQEVDAASNCRFVTSTLTNELRQGIPNPAAASTGTGYLSLSPAVAPTAVLTPNQNVRTATELVFTEPHPTSYDPLASGFDPQSPASYRRVRYYLSGATMRREVRTYTSTGTVATTQDALLASGDSMALGVTWVAPDLFDVDVTCTRGRDSATLRTRVFVVGR